MHDAPASIDAANEQRGGAACRDRIATADATRQDVLGDQVRDVRGDRVDVLATFDPIGAMAGADPAQMDALVADAQTDDPALRALLDDLARRAGFLAGLGDAPRSCW